MDNSYWESFKEKNKCKWHFDPFAKSEDFTYIGRLKNFYVKKKPEFLSINKTSLC